MKRQMACAATRLRSMPRRSRQRKSSLHRGGRSKSIFLRHRRTCRPRTRACAGGEGWRCGAVQYRAGCRRHGRRHPATRKQHARTWIMMAARMATLALWRSRRSTATARSRRSAACRRVGVAGRRQSEGVLWGPTATRLGQRDDEDPRHLQLLALAQGRDARVRARKEDGMFLARSVCLAPRCQGCLPLRRLLLPLRRATEGGARCAEQGG